MVTKNIRRVLSGIRTTGPLHLGHYCGALKNWIQLQNKYDCYFLLADVQALTTHFDRTKEIEISTREVILDFLSVGLDPEKSTFVLQSQIPELAELSMYFGLITKLKELQNNPTIKDELKKQKEVLYGFVGYPVFQAADILLFTRIPFKEGDELLVPVGKDQAPHIEFSRDIAKRFNQRFGKVFVTPTVLIGDVSNLPGLDMGEKMGKSTGNAIFLKDSPEVVKAKVKQAFTDPTKAKVDDIGRPHGCAIFQYYRALAPKIADEIEIICQQGKIGCGDDKERLAKIVNEFLDPIREKREEFLKDSDFIKDIMVEGIKKAREIGQGTMEAVRSAMSIDHKNLLGR